MIRIFLVLSVIVLAGAQVSAASTTLEAIDYVGSVSINPSQDAKEEDSSGRFANFIDPDGNKVTIWGAAK